MNKFYIFFLICFIPVLLFGQKRKKQDLSFVQLDSVLVDGQLTEWHNYLLNRESAYWSYAVSVNDGQLFIAVRVKDEALQREALSGGIFVNISNNEKKKGGAKLFYPSIDREQWRALLDNEQVVDSTLMRDLLGRVRGYQVQGFEQIRDGLLSLDNTYGINAIARFDVDNVLTYEAVIPLDLIKLTQDRIAVQLGINTSYLRANKMKATGMRPGNARVYGAARNTTVLKDPYKEETVVWFLGNIK